MKPKILILAGDGINCERDTARAFTLAGAEPTVLHINDLLENPAKLRDFQVMALPGGFSFGDDLGSGQILALKLEHGLGDHFREFVNAKRPVIGICNGFQALTKLGLLPQLFGQRTMALARNQQGHFQDRWVGLELEEGSVCIWTKSLMEWQRREKEALELPIRHGEGRVVFTPGEEDVIHRTLSQAGQIPLRYIDNVNGSYGRVAGVCDPSGLVFGLMPHPEAAISLLQHPRAQSLSAKGIDLFSQGLGLKVFEDCVSYLREA